MAWLDKMRGAYVNMPLPLRQAAAPLLSLVPWSLRYGGTYDALRSDLVRAERDGAFVRARAASMLREVVASAATTEHYSPLLYAAGLDWSLPDEDLFARLSNLPILTRADIAADPDGFLARPRGELDERRTSGSSSRVPAVFYLDRNRSVREMAFLHHFWSHMGYKRGDGRVLLTGTLRYAARGGAWGWDPALRELWLNAGRLDPETMDAHLALMDRFKVPFLFGMPSAISILAAHHLRTRGTPMPYLKGVISTSETLFPHQRVLIETAFSVPVRPFYGLTERVAIAEEIAPDTYAFHPLYGHCELVDDAGVAVTEAGKFGRVIATGLGGIGMPLIRYETGDRARLVETPSTANQCTLKVAGIRSKWSQEYLVSKTRALVPVSVALPEEGYGLIEAFQFAQAVEGEATLRIVPTATATRNQIETTVLDPIRTVVGEHLRLDLELVPMIAPGPNNKRRFVEQGLDLNAYCWMGSTEAKAKSEIAA